MIGAAVIAVAGCLLSVQAVAYGWLFMRGRTRWPMAAYTAAMGAASAGGAYALLALLH